MKELIINWQVETLELPSYRIEYIMLSPTMEHLSR